MSYVFFKHEGVYLQLKLDVAFGVVLHGWRKDCVGLAYAFFKVPNISGSRTREFCCMSIART